MRMAGCVDVVWKRRQQRRFFHEPLHLADDGTKAAEGFGLRIGQKTHKSGRRGENIAAAPCRTQIERKRELRGADGRVQINHAEGRTGPPDGPPSIFTTATMRLDHRSFSLGK